MILCWMVLSKKSIMFSDIYSVCEVNTTYGFSTDIFSKAFMQASDSSMKCMALIMVSHKHCTPPWFTTVPTIFGEMSIRFANDSTAWTNS